MKFKKSALLTALLPLCFTGPLFAQDIEVSDLGDYRYENPRVHYKSYYWSEFQSIDQQTYSLIGGNAAVQYGYFNPASTNSVTRKPRFTFLTALG